MTRDELLQLPKRTNILKELDQVRYDSLLIFGTGKKHASGWGELAIIGCIATKPTELITDGADDITWNLHNTLRTDCLLPSRTLHFWCQDLGRFEISYPISSITITLHATESPA